MSAERPVLAVDVDGVISLFGFEGPLDQAPGRFHLIDGIAHCISDVAGPQLLRLGESYELVWATGWEDRANDHLPTILGLPDKLPCLHFDGRARFGTPRSRVGPVAVTRAPDDGHTGWNTRSVD